MQRQHNHSCKIAKLKGAKTPPKRAEIGRCHPLLVPDPRVVAISEIRALRILGSRVGKGTARPGSNVPSCSNGKGTGRASAHHRRERRSACIVAPPLLFPGEGDGG